ncbi:MAG: hypothetical protein HZC38_12110, partial [Chloroflexi bacterium]|nr:hypothetical protein [Chloroflexota bacterium]
ARVGKRLLVGTSYSSDGGGLYEFDNGRFKTVSFPSVHEDQKGKLSYNVTAIGSDKKNNLWIGTTNGVGRYDGKNWTRFSVENGLPHERITALLVDERDGVVIGTENGMAFIEGNEVRVANEKFAVYGIAYDNKFTFWFPSSGGIARFDPTNRAVKTYDHTNSELPPDVNFTSVAKGEDGTLYFGSEVGISRYGSDGKFAYWQMPNVPLRASYDRILNSPDGLLWFVEQYYINVDRFDPAAQKWSPLLPPLCGCVPLAFDAAGNMWASEWDQGLWIVNKKDKINVSAHQGLPSNNVFSVAFPKDGAAWVGTEKGLALLRDQQKVERVFNKANAGFTDDTIRALLVAADKTLWVGTTGGVSHLRADDKWEHFVVGNPFEREMGEVTSIAQANDGSIWVATSQSGVYQLKDGKWLRFTPRDPGVKLPSLEVRRITAAPDGSVWFATGEGAARFDGKEWIRFRAQANELVGEMVNDIFVTKSGEVYFATGAGVSRWKP